MASQGFKILEGGTRRKWSLRRDMSAERLFNGGGSRSYADWQSYQRLSAHGPYDLPRDSYQSRCSI